MRSLIILEVEHGEDTDEFTDLAEHLAGEVSRYSWCETLDYSVRVDLPACFVLDSGER